MPQKEIYINARFLTQKIAGVQRFAIELSRRLKKLNPEIKFVCPPDIYHQTLADELEVIVVGKLNSHLWEQIELPIFLKTKGSPLLVNLCSTAPLFYKNQIVSIHDAIFCRHPEWFSKMFAKWYNFLLPKNAKNSKKIITVSNHAKQDLHDCLNIQLDKFEVVYNSVDEKFKDLTVTETNKQKYILSVSSLDPRKNFDNLIKAYLSLENTEYDLVIVGAESKSFPKHQLFETISNNNKIKFTGYVNDDELIKYYKEASLFIYPSLYEGFGIPPLEAMACGTPVIASNNSSIPEVCDNAAVYVDATNYLDIAEKINLVLNDNNLQKSLIAKGYERLNSFSWEKSSEKLSTIIKSFV